MERDPSLRLPIGSGGNWRPPVAPRPGQRGVLDERGRRGAPRRASALSSPGKKTKGRRKRKSEEDKEMEPIDADAIPGLESRSSQFTILGAGDRGWGYAGTLPQLHKDPGLSVWRPAGVPRRLRGCGGRGLGGPPGPPTVWVAGLTADLSKLEGEVGQMRGFPLVGGFLRAPAASRWSGGPRPLGGGQRFTWALDES